MCFKAGLAQKEEKTYKKGGQGWFKHIISLPLPFCRKKRLCQKIEVYHLPFFAKKRR